MALYGHSVLSGVAHEATTDDLKDLDLKPYIELMAYDDISRGDADQIHEFCESAIAQVLQEKQVLNKGTLMRLSKADDEKRRIKLVAYQLAKDAKDPDWDKMQKYRAEWKKYRGKIMRKYGARATKIAKQAQKEYIKNARKEPSEPVKK